jgi:hypothetical protein
LALRQVAVGKLEWASFGWYSDKYLDSVFVVDDISWHLGYDVTVVDLPAGLFCGVDGVGRNSADLFPCVFIGNVEAT